MLPVTTTRDPALAPELALEVRQALVRREPDALAAFFEAYFDRIHSYLRRLVREEHLAEDLTQDVFLHIHRSLAGYDAERPLAPWVFTIATNKVRDLWRSRRHQEAGREISTDDEERAPSLASSKAGPVEQLEVEENSRRVADAIAELPEMLRQTVILRYYEGLSFEAIGEVVDRNETAVRKRYSRALQELRRVLTKNAESNPGSAGPSSAVGT